MREVMAPHLKAVVMVTLDCLSDIEDKVWGQLQEELKDDTRLNDMRIESSRGTILTDILQACKALMSEEVLDDMVVDLIKVV